MFLFEIIIEKICNFCWAIYQIFHNTFTLLKIAVMLPGRKQIFHSCTFKSVFMFVSLTVILWKSLSHKGWFIWNNYWEKYTIILAGWYIKCKIHFQWVCWLSNIIRAAKWLIMINQFKIKVCSHTIFVCTVYIYYIHIKTPTYVG